MTRTEDNLIQRQARVVHNERVAEDTYLLRLEQPEIARSILPGQFVMVRPLHGTDPLLARPFALYDVIDDENQSPSSIDLVYIVIGNGTRSLSRLERGNLVDLWGPLGNTFPTQWTGTQSFRLFIIAGGIGQTPFLAVIKELLGLRRYGLGRPVNPPENVTFAWGVRTKSLVALIEDFQRTGVDVQIATDDGSLGHNGFVTGLLESAMESDEPPGVVFACGPEPMLHKTANICRSAQVPCWVSLENKMACGYGVCFSCVCPVLQPDADWDYRRVCIEGPVFDADTISWPALREAL